MPMHRRVMLAGSLIAIATAYCFGQATASRPTGKEEIRLFEIRTYTAEPNKLEALNARFRDHTTELFEKHGMTNIGYWTPTDGERSKDTLIYLLVHASREAAEKSWRDFRSDPVWLKARGESEAAGPIVKKVESIFVTPTDYSPLK
jgi:NIPSNAP